MVGVAPVFPYNPIETGPFLDGFLLKSFFFLFSALLVLLRMESEAPTWVPHPDQNGTRTKLPFWASAFLHPGFY